MMVGIVVSLLGTLAMMSVFAAFEAQKRTTSSGNDAQQNGSYSLYALERQIRTAGSGIVQGNRYGVWGCTINAYSGGAQRLPAGGAFPSQFAAWPTTVLVAPVLVADGGADVNGNAASDIIGVIRGNPALRTFKASIGPGSNLTVPLDNSLGMLNGDYLLNADKSGNCWLGLATAIVTTLTGIGNQATLSATDSPGAGFANGYVFDMGPEPAFNLYAVNQTTHSLEVYDLLQRGAAPVPPSPVADGIVVIKALYGIDSNANCPTQTSFADTGAVVGVIDNWVAPTGPYALAALTADNKAACTAMARIKAVRVAVVAQSELPERAVDYTGASTLTLFPDLAGVGLARTITAQPQYRYKVYDTTIPVRNAFISKLY